MASRSVAKRAEKTKVALQNVPAPSAIREIIPGKLNEDDWSAFLDVDDSLSFVTELIHEVLDKTIEKCFMTYIRKQVIPYTVYCARKEIFSIIDLSFIDRDNGMKTDICNKVWQEDQEPCSLHMDCWAQGAVPRIIAATRNKTESPVFFDSGRDSADSMSMEVPGAHISENLVPNDVHDTQTSGQPPFPFMEAVKTMTPIDELSEPDNTSSKPKRTDISETFSTENVTDPLTDERKYNEFRDNILCGAVESSSESSGICAGRSEGSAQVKTSRHIEMPNAKVPHALTGKPVRKNALKLQVGRPPGEKDVSYDDLGNVVGVRRIESNELPNHLVKTRFVIVDPKVESEQSALEAMRTGKVSTAGLITSAHKPKPPTKPRSNPDQRRQVRALKFEVGVRNTNTNVTAGNHRRTKFQSSEHNSSQQQQQRLYKSGGGLPPPLFGNVEIAAGVTVREGDIVLRGPERKPARAETLPTAAAADVENNYSRTDLRRAVKLRPVQRAEHEHQSYLHVNDVITTSSSPPNSLPVGMAM